MAIGVVDELEMVDIRHHGGDRPAGAGVLDQDLIRKLLEVPAVWKSRQDIMGGQDAQLLHEVVLSARVGKDKNLAQDSALPPTHQGEARAEAADRIAGSRHEIDAGLPLLPEEIREIRPFSCQLVHRFPDVLTAKFGKRDSCGFVEADDAEVVVDDDAPLLHRMEDRRQRDGREIEYPGADDADEEDDPHERKAERVDVNSVGSESRRVKDISDQDDEGGEENDDRLSTEDAGALEELMQREECDDHHRCGYIQEGEPVYRSFPEIYDR